VNLRQLIDALVEAEVEQLGGWHALSEEATAHIEALASRLRLQAATLDAWMDEDDKRIAMSGKE
jgi:hypothetical protein